MIFFALIYENIILTKEILKVTTQIFLKREADIWHSFYQHITGDPNSHFHLPYLIILVTVGNEKPPPEFETGLLVKMKEQKETKRNLLEETHIQLVLISCFPDNRAL